ncbi:hypothetical protein [Roseiterribacter gracilis]|uniref:Uncharacterized protein n=1 Tax=Roseiterribacter gracilis TaxID=2812848 RepID=A0A8S8X6T1_9PROT|nr:hypothetical protein TMPK1_12850 [Rhodospirillales bacterium TMPK1]
MATALKPTQTNFGPPKGRRTIENSIMTLMLVGLGAVFLPTTITAAFAMIPSILSYFFDRDPKRSQTLCIAALNAAGSTPVLLELWGRWNSVAGAISLIAQVRPWMWAWGGAALGYALCLLIPPVAAQMVRGGLQNKLNDLEKHAKDMRQAWGEDVAPEHMARLIESSAFSSQK